MHQIDLCAMLVNVPNTAGVNHTTAVPSVRANEVVAVSVIAAIIYWPQLMRRWVLELNMYIYL